MKELQTGVVIRSGGASYIVEGADGSLFRCWTGAGTVSDNEGTSLVAVGDRVTFNPKASGTDVAEGVITHVAERTSALIRRRDIRRNRSKEKAQVIAANIDQLVVVTSAADPPFNRRLIDRYLVFAESEHLPVLIVVNKTDLDHAGLLENELATYRRLDCRICLVSASRKRGLEELTELLSGQVSAFSGHSGVGKSTLINRLIGRRELKTAQTSSRTGKGVHTTSSSIMIRLPEGGYVIDTPGIREFNLSGITKENLRFYFREFLRFMPDCSYSSCSHTVEPGCAVKRAVETGEIDAERYESYLALLNSIEAEV